jgi:hypothetical protein
MSDELKPAEEDELKPVHVDPVIIDVQVLKERDFGGQNLRRRIYIPTFEGRPSHRLRS